MLEPNQQESFAARGLITLSRHGRFTELQYSFPLKLMSPKMATPNPHMGVCYVLSFGGGLVSGDSVLLAITVEAECSLVMLTQGSTKVFKIRGQTSVRSLPSLPGEKTAQFMDVKIASSASLFLLPSAVTCFASASYSQKQRFLLHDDTSSLILLDAFTSGRMARSEEWQFDRYRSENEVYIGSDRVLKDVLLLQHPSVASTSIRASPVVQDGYACYASLFLFGPATKDLQAHFAALFDAELQYRTSKPANLLWSYSEVLPDQRGGVVRVAADSTEVVRNWICQELRSLEATFGSDLLRQVWS